MVDDDITAYNFSGVMVANDGKVMLERYRLGQQRRAYRPRSMRTDVDFTL